LILVPPGRSDVRGDSWWGRRREVGIEFREDAKCGVGDWGDVGALIGCGGVGGDNPGHVTVA